MKINIFKLMNKRVKKIDFNYKILKLKEYFIINNKIQLFNNDKILKLLF